VHALERVGGSGVIPWFLPGVVIGAAIAYLAGRRVSLALGARRAVAVALIASLGLILSATISPLRAALEFGAVGTGSCDFSRIGFAPLRDLLRFGDTSLNVLLFVPLGASIAFIPRSRLKLLVVFGAIALPFAIETTQLLWAWLDRACESADVIDNLTGLAIGLGGGAFAGWIAAALARRAR
jgi:glycopeptide antibiotics resistance protein